MAQNEGRAGETKVPRECIGLDHGVELGAVPRHPGSAQARSQQRKGSSDVAGGIVRSRVFVVWCFVFFVAVVVLLLIPIGGRVAGRHRLETGSSENPTHGWQVTVTSPWWSQGWRWGQIVAGSLPGRANPPAHPGEAGLGASSLTGLMDHQCINCEDEETLLQIPVHQFPKWVLQEPVLWMLTDVCKEVTYQNQMHLGGAHSQVHTF